MDANFGEAVFITTKLMNEQLLACECGQEGYYRLFKLKSSKRLANGTLAQYFECRGCTGAIDGNDDGGRKARLTVKDGIITTDPNRGHLATCHLTPTNEVEIRKITQETRRRCRTEGKRPITAYREALNSIAVRYPIAHEQDEIAIGMPSYKRVRRSLYRHLTQVILPIPDENNLPPEYTLTFRGREAYKRDPNDLLAQERFLLHQSPTMIVFASAADMDVIHQSEYLIADGTFEMVPKQFAQLYTIHGFKNGEAVPVCHALLRNKQRATYEELFGVLRNGVIGRRGTLGALHSILMDFELAAHEAARMVFQVDTLGCLFHFGQCLLRGVQRNGLQTAYQNGIGGLKDWISFIKALALLPSDLVLMIWQRWLRNPPQMANPLDQRKVAEFIVYLENTWLYGGFPVRMWNHFTNTWRHPPRQAMPGPRTTNHAEGWHSKLNHDFGHPHPSLCTFLHWLQSTHHVTQVRVMRLGNGAQPIPRDERYENVDRRLLDEKNAFLYLRANMPQHLPDAANMLSYEAEAYLRRVAHLLG